MRREVDKTKRQVLYNYYNISLYYWTFIYVWAICKQWEEKNVKGWAVTIRPDNQRSRKGEHWSAFNNLALSYKANARWKTMSMQQEETWWYAFISLDSQASRNGHRETPAAGIWSTPRYSYETNIGLCLSWLVPRVWLVRSKQRNRIISLLRRSKKNE